MKYKIYTEPDLYLESLYLLDSIFNNKPIENEKKIALEKYVGSITEDDLNPIYAEAAALEEYVRQNTRFDLPGFEADGKEIAGFLYKTRDNLDNYPASAFYFYDLFLSHGVDDKILSILAYAMEDYFDTEELDIKPHNINGGAELFQLIDSLESGVSTKYDIIKLYYSFEAYYDYNTRLVEHVSSLIKSRLGGFDDKICCCMARIDDELKENGVRFFHDICGVDIDGALEYEVRPLIYWLNRLSFWGSRLTGNQIGVGVGFLELNDMTSNARPFKDTLFEFLKLLSDGTKLSIIQMLKEEPCYGVQIAERLGLTGATISYHMAALIKLDVVFIKKENIKVYYSLNTEKIRQYLDGVYGLLL